MTDFTTFLDNNGKLAVNTGGNIHGIYRYTEIIGDLTTLTTSCQRSHDFGPSYYNTSDIENIQTRIQVEHN